MNIGCLSVNMTRAVEATATMSLATIPPVASMERIGGMKVNMGLVCGSSLGYGIVLWASDAMLITVDDGKLYVTKK